MPSTSENKGWRGRPSAGNLNGYAAAKGDQETHNLSNLTTAAMKALGMTQICSDSNEG